MDLSRLHFWLNILLAFGSLVMESIGLYITYRWIVTISIVSNETRALLLGESLDRLLSNDKALQAIAILFLFASVVRLMVSAASWKFRLEHDRERLTRIEDDAYDRLVAEEHRKKSGHAALGKEKI